MMLCPMQQRSQRMEDRYDGMLVVRSELTHVQSSLSPVKGVVRHWHHCCRYTNWTK